MACLVFGPAVTLRDASWRLCVPERGGAPRCATIRLTLGVLLEAHGRGGNAASAEASSDGGTTLMRRVLWLAVLGLLMSLLASTGVGAGVAVEQTSSPGERAGGLTLKVRVSGLPEGEVAGVQVTGPGRYRQRVTQTTTLRGLAPGRYRVIAKRVDLGQAVVYPADRSRTVRVSRGRAGQASVNYATKVPDDTMIVKPRVIDDVRRTAGGQQVVTFDGDVPNLQVGDVLVTGTGRQTPTGLLTKVAAVRRSGAVEVRRTTLLDAVPRGTLDASATLSSDDLATARFGVRPLASREISVPVRGKLGRCSGDVTSTVRGSVDVTPDFRFNADWNLLRGGVTSARFVGTVTQSAELKAAVEGAASCSGRRPLLAKPLTFRPITVPVGPLSVVMVPRLQLHLTGSADVAASVSASATQELVASAGLAWSRADGISPIGSVTNSRSFQSPEVSASGDLRASVDPQLDLLLYGAGGPQLRLSGGLRLHADTTARPWWVLDAFVNAGAGLVVPALRLDKHKDGVLRRTWRLTDSGAGDPPDDEEPNDLAGTQTSPDLNCYVQRSTDTHDQFYGPGACGTFVAVDGVLYGPNEVRAAWPLDQVGYTPLSQSLAGRGTIDNPYTTTTRVALGDTGVRLTQVDTFIEGQAKFTTDVTLRDTTGITRDVIVYRAGDCYVADDDTGLGGLGSAGQAICRNEDGSKKLELIPTTTGSTFYEDEYLAVWSAVATLQALPNTCACDERVDNGIALRWNKTLPANNSITVESRIRFGDYG